MRVLTVGWNLWHIDHSNEDFQREPPFGKGYVTYCREMDFVVNMLGKKGSSSSIVFDANGNLCGVIFGGYGDVLTAMRVDKKSICFEQFFENIEINSIGYNENNLVFGKQSQVQRFLESMETDGIKSFRRAKCGDVLGKVEFTTSPHIQSEDVDTTPSSFQLF